MATTTNYGWTTPNDTDLVKDGAAAIRTLGSSVDTTTKNLNPQTTTGALAYRSATANVNTALAIGSTGQVLTVAAGVPTWATPAGGGGMTLLSTTTLSGASTTISGISQDYIDLYIYAFGFTNATADGEFRIDPNGSNNIVDQVQTINVSGGASLRDNGRIVPANVSSFDRTLTTGAVFVKIEQYSNANTQKTFISNCNAGGYPNFAFGYVQSNTAISSLVFSNSGGNWTAGTVLLYGVK